MLATMAMIGQSTLFLIAILLAMEAVKAPSAKGNLDKSAWLPNDMPYEKLRDFGLEQVRTKSPNPESPDRVFCCAPSLVASLVSSANPRAIKAASALAPNCMERQTPTATAITFLSAPPNSTPTRSSLAYNLKAGSDIINAKVCALEIVFEAMVMAVGRPLAMSLAKLGPESADIFTSGSI